MTYSINLLAQEFVQEGFSLQLTSRAALDPRSAQQAISLKGVRSDVVLDAKARVASLVASPTLGRRELLVENLLDSRGKIVVAHLELPFYVVRFVGKVPKNVAVLSFVRVRFESERVIRLDPFAPARGKYLEILKVVDRASEECEELAFDQNGKRVDVAKQQQVAEQAAFARFGKLDPALHAELARARASARIPIAAWASSASIEPFDKSAKSAARTARAHLDLAARARAELVAAAGELAETAKCTPDPLAPMFRAELTVAEIRRLAAAKELGAIVRDWSSTAILDLDDSVAIANADDVHTLGQTGTGVDVAVWEDGPSDTTQLTLAGQFDATPPASGHARLTHAIIKNAQTVGSTGYAPDCNLFSANRTSAAALAWAVQQGCTVISQSFHRANEPGSATLSADDLYKDWLALHQPWPTIVQAAGNYWLGDSDSITPPSDEYVNHKGYNSLAVGNHNDTATAMDGTSVFRNPSSLHGDRELPEIAANGTVVTAVGESRSGTSFAAPAVAGTIALLQGANRTLRSWPEGCRAIVLASATRNVAASTWWADVSAGVDASDGAGALDALNCRRLASARVGPDNRPGQRGWDVGTLESADFDGKRFATFVYRLVLPPDGPRRVKIALAWNSAVGVVTAGAPTYRSKLVLDFDLHVYDKGGHQVGYSGSWDNSYEIAEFRGTPGETYTIRIRRFSGTASTWYGIAWLVS